MRRTWMEHLHRPPNAPLFTPRELAGGCEVDRGAGLKKPVGENWWNRIGLNFKTTEFIIYCFKISKKKIKVSKKYVKKLDQILRLLVFL
jgi:hypothetical protein